MKRTSLILAAAASISLAACDTLTPQQQLVAGGLTGVAAGLLTARALSANPQWTILSVLAGAAVGTLVAKNTATNQCAYANGSGNYYTADCP